MTHSITGSCVKEYGFLDRVWMMISRKSSWRPLLGVMCLTGTCDSCRFLRGPRKKLKEIREGLFKEFKKPKSEAQYITELKEIKQFPNETIWDFD